MSPAQLKPFLITAFKHRRKVLIKGAPGIGKSDIVEQAVAACQMDFMLQHPVVSDPTDFKGKRRFAAAPC